jgi:hypothetical protein
LKIHCGAAPAPGRGTLLERKGKVNETIEKLPRETPCQLRARLAFLLLSGMKIRNWFSYGENISILARVEQRGQTRLPPPWVVRH